MRLMHATNGDAYFVVPQWVYDAFVEQIQRQAMPYKSLAQERYFNANRGKLERQGVNVSEWNRASKGKKLPKRKRKRKSRG